MRSLARWPIDVRRIGELADSAAGTDYRRVRDDRPSSVPLNKPSVESLIAANYPGLRLLIQQKAGDAEVAADLLNDAICTTWEKWQAGKIERPEQIAGYVFQVAMNLLRNRRRAAGDRSDLRAPPATLDELAGGVDPSERSIEEAMARSVKQLLSGMESARDRLVLTRFYLEEEDKESICRALALTTLQFDKVLHRARGRLRKLLESQGLHSRDFLSILMVV